MNKRKLDALCAILNDVNDVMIDNYGEPLSWDQVYQILVPCNDAPIGDILNDWNARLGVPQDLIDDIAFIVRS